MTCISPHVFGCGGYQDLRKDVIFMRKKFTETTAFSIICMLSMMLTLVFPTYSFCLTDQKLSESVEVHSLQELAKNDSIDVKEKECLSSAPAYSPVNFIFNNPEVISEDSDLIVKVKNKDDQWYEIVFPAGENTCSYDFPVGEYTAMSAYGGSGVTMVNFSFTVSEFTIVEGESTDITLDGDITGKLSSPEEVKEIRQKIESGEYWDEQAAIEENIETEQQELQKTNTEDSQDEVSIKGLFGQFGGFIWANKFNIVFVVACVVILISIRKKKS